MKEKGCFDLGFFMTVIILLCFGLIMVFSASAPFAYHHYNNSYFFVKKQLMWALIGIIVLFIMANVNYRILSKYSILILILSILMLVAVLVVGKPIKGVKRWLGVGSLTIQPSEFAKIAIIIFFSSSLAKKKDKIKKFFTGLMPYIIILGIFAVLLVKEPHYSCTAIILMIGIILLFASGAKILHFFLLALPVAGIFIYAIYTGGYTMNRVTTFLDPYANKTSEGWQIIQSLYAIGSGGLFGLGLGRSRQKFLYLPEPQNDFIFSIICEELGFIGAGTILILFIVLIWKGIKIALNAPDAFGSLLATGIISLIAVQVIINVAVVTSTMPVTGMPLPFFSAGGSSLVFLLGSMGIMLNISRYSKSSKKRRR